MSSKSVNNKTTRTLILITAICLALGVYFVLLGQRGITLIQQGGVVPIGLGIGVMILPFLGLWLVISTLRAGFTHQRLAQQIVDEGLAVDASSLPKLPSGRIERAAADELFAKVKVDWEADPDNWKQNFRLARAYDYAGDRSRARETMRRAVELERRERGR
ncbi:hypothetical protein [Rhodococcus sp. ARC_M6]|uniref:hypothetical protein n=1 Tax=Rhodococcus sp. ARC_M6 TaxID=2928852 RepID=UPI001FB3E9C4|nr:hypothetical protein [Rhodococcus sp. ARC_M6]MCJ0902782.1 hypothetical protein [Rhodococcus sp. ARC_M6]